MYDVLIFHTTPLHSTPLTDGLNDVLHDSEHAIDLRSAPKDFQVYGSSEVSDSRDDYR
jgi:hypothetical protein